MARSILDTFGLAITLAFALPVAYAGVVLLSEGRTTFGAALLAIAVLMVAIEEYLTTPMDVPGMVAGKVLGRAVKEPDESGKGDGTVAGTADGAAQPETAGDSSDEGDDEKLIPDAERD